MFIVLEGLDGAGKSTQIKLLQAMFEERGLACAYLHFPRFDAPVYGELIARFLRGEFGSAAEVDPYVVALLYAGDRADAAAQLRAWLAEGKVVILDRYLYSNIAYQCAKLPAGEERERLKRWILKLEYDYHGIPEPDLSLFLDVPFAFTERKLTTQRAGDDRSYLQGAEDVHEASLALQQRVREVYLDIARSDARLQVVDCRDAVGGMETPEGIFARIRSRIVRLPEFSAEARPGTTSGRTPGTAPEGAPASDAGPERMPAAATLTAAPPASAPASEPDVPEPNPESVTDAYETTL